MAIDLQKLNKDKLDLLGKRIKGEATANEALRKDKEQEFLEALRQIEMQYDPEALGLMTEDEPKMYPGYTRSKTIPLQSKLIQNLVPDKKELNWGIKPSPVPSVSQKTLDFVVASLSQAMKTTPDKLTPEIIIDGIMAITADRAGKMQTVIADQLLDDDYREKEKLAICSAVNYGTGIIKGSLSEPYSYTDLVMEKISPVNAVKGLISTGSFAMTKWRQKTRDYYRPSAEHVEVWNWFPDMSATTIDKCKFVDILRSETKHGVKKLADREDFFGDIINKYLDDNPKGDYKLRDWEVTISQTGTHNVQIARDSGKYEIIERDVYLDGQELQEMGIEDADDRDTYFYNIWLLGDKIIRISKWDERHCKRLEDIYHLFYYEKNETSIFGKGLPKIIRYPQLALAACDRNMLKNAAWIAGPLGEINVHLLEESALKDANKVYPGKFFIRDSGPQDASSKVLNVYSIESRINEFLTMKNDFRMQGDSDSSLPSYLFGDTQGAKDTPLGTAKMQFASMIDFIKNLAASFDKMHKSYIRSVYNWNMAFNPDESIKGDMEIHTTGSAAAVINETIVAQMSFLVQSLPDEAKARIKWGEWLHEIFKLSFPEYDKMIKTDEEYAQDMQAQQDQQMQMLQMQAGLAQAKIGKDQATAEKTKVTTQKIAAEIPHTLAGKEAETEGKRVDSAAKIVDMQHKKEQMRAMDIDNMLKVAESMKEDTSNGPA